MFISATAGNVASFGIRNPDYGALQEDFKTANTRQRYIRWFAAHKPQVSDTKPEALIQSPGNIAPRWLGLVQARVRGSVVQQGQEVSDDGRLLRADVADAALGFFQLMSDLLPGEPFIYGSKRGELVAEFTANHGTLTGIVTPQFVVLFAVVDGVPVERRLVLGNDSPGLTELRRELHEVTELLCTGQHGAVDTTK